MSTLPALLASVEASALAAALRDSVWAYPLVNAGHILGVGLLIGAIVAWITSLTLGRLVGYF